MNCCDHCESADKVFDRREAEDKLREYRRKGAARTTRLLLDALKAAGVREMTLLDIGGGVGAIQHDLLNNGAASAVGVDASRAYLAAAEEESRRQGHADRVTYHFGDFVQLAPDIAPADIVTLDRVICCYPDMPALVGASAAKARRFYALVYPRDTWWMKLAQFGLNFSLRLQRSSFHFFVHSARAVEDIVCANGFERRFSRTQGTWQVVVYGRASFIS